MADGRGRNEGTVDLSYKPPAHYKKITTTDDEATEYGFGWSSINDNPDIDMWAVRIPAGLKPADLAGLKIKLPSGSADNLTGKLKKGGASFVLQSVGEEGAFGVGEEMQNMRCMLPKDDDAALYTVTRPLRHLVLTRQEPVPTPTAAPPPAIQHTRRPQPVDRLKHSFAPIGTLLLSPRSHSPKPMDIDESESPKKKRKKQSQVEATTESKTPKKSKAKTIVGVDETMQVDDITPVASKRRKKPPAVGKEAQSQNVDISVKKEKKK